MKLSDCIIRIDQLEAYSPDAHVGTVNRRIIGRETVGSGNFELVLGIIDPKGKAEPHFHTSIEQTIYVLEGKVEVEMLGEKGVIVTGDTVYIPPGEIHQFTVLGEQPAKFLIIYCPPLESTDKPFER